MKKPNVTIPVINGKVDTALKRLKKQMEREGVTRDMKKSVYFESPSQKNRKRKLRAIKQNYIRMMSSRLS